MTDNSVLLKQISRNPVMASYDASCKRLLSNKTILAWIIKSCIKEYEACEIEYIAKHCLEENSMVGQDAVHPDEVFCGEQIRGSAQQDTSAQEGTITYDIKVCAWLPGTEEGKERGRLFLDIEAQNDFHPGYLVVTRGIYYVGRMISAQYGTEFTHSRYGDLKKVYSIWICSNPPVGRRRTMNTYGITEKCLAGAVKESENHYDLLEVIIICLGDGREKGGSGIFRLLEVLLSPYMRAGEKIKILKDEFSIVMERKFEEEVREMCDLSIGVAEWGMEQGIKEGICTAIKNLMSTTNWSAEQAMEALKIPEKEREAYAEQLREQTV